MSIGSKPAHPVEPEVEDISRITEPEQGPCPEQETPAPRAPEASLDPQRLLRIQAISLAILATAAVLTVCYLAKLPLMVLLVSILLAYMLAPVAEWLQRIRLPRSLAALLAVLMLMVVVYGIVSVSYYRAQAFVQDLPRYSGEIRQMAGHLRRTSENLQKTAAGVLPANPEDNNAVKVHQTNAWADFFTKSLGSLTEFVFAASFVPFLVYFMLTWQEHARSASVMLFRKENRPTAYATMGQISSMVRSFIVGNVVVGIFISLISLAVFAALGLPYFYFLGFISGFLSLVPYLGVLLAIVPPLAAGLGQIHSTGLLIIVGTVFGLHVFALNVLYPKIIGSRLQLNPLAVTLALLFWGWLWGAMGLILAIPITAAMKIVMEHMEHLRPYSAWLSEE